MKQRPLTVFSAMVSVSLVCMATSAFASGTAPSGPAASTPEQAGPLECTRLEEGDYSLDDDREAVLDTVPVGETFAGFPRGQSILTEGDQQYVAYYDGDRGMTVAQRSTDSDSWTKVRLDETIGWDSHNGVVLATDRDGHVHVSGNMHATPLVYFRTKQPGDVTSLERVNSMVDPERESDVTYPTFLNLEDGTLVFRYRQGGSGDGVDIYNKYDESTRTWTPLVDEPILDGEGERNAYATEPELGPDGRYHMVWIWRDTPMAATSHTVAYARSDDLVNWESSSGTDLPLPITYGSGDVVDPVPPYGGAINRNVQVGFDANEEPVVAYHKYDDEGNTQLYVARPNDGSTNGWNQVQVSDWTGAWEFDQGGGLNFEVEVFWSPTLLGDDNLRLDVICQGDARTFVIDGETLEPIAEFATPPREPAEVTEVRSDYEHDEPDEQGTEMQVNLNSDSGDSVEQDEHSRHLLRWESLGGNRDQPRASWPAPHPIEVVTLGTEEACRNEGWRQFVNPGFRGEGDCVQWVAGRINDRSHGRG